MLLGELPTTLRCGEFLPDSIVSILTAASVHGIIGNEVFNNRIVGYFPRRNSLVISR
jgi:hypothetical protein